MKEIQTLSYNWEVLRPKPGYFITMQGKIPVRKQENNSPYVNYIIDVAMSLKDTSPMRGTFGKTINITFDDHVPSFGTALFGDKKGTKNPNFKQQCLDGHIVMSNYLIYRHILTDNDVGGRQFISRQDRGQSTHWQEPGKWSDGIIPFSTIRAQAQYVGGNWTTDNYTNIGGVNRNAHASFDQYLNLYLTTERVGFNAASYGFKASEFNQKLLSIAESYEYKNEMIQKTLAKANSGDIDALTTVAEMPELINSIIDGFKFLHKMAKEAKTKEFKIFSSVPSRTRLKAQAAFDRYRRNQLKRIPPSYIWLRRNRGKTLHDYQQFVNSRRDAILNLDEYIRIRGQKYRVKAVKEVTDEVTQVWLNYRYNISTTVYMLQDIGSVLENYGTEFMRYRDKQVIEIDPPVLPLNDYATTGKVIQTHRCLIKRKYDVSDAVQKLGRALMADILVTGFELWRLWSIVSDWFFTISDCLKAIPWSKNHVEEGSTYSVKTEFKGTISFSSSSGIRFTMKSEFAHYQRIVINPYNSIGIFWSPEFNFVRQLDALSFAWGSLSKRPMKNYLSN